MLRDLSGRLLRRDLFKAVTVADSHGDVLAFLGSHREVRRAFARRRLSMDYHFIVDEQVAAGYRPYSAVNSDDKATAIDHIVVAGRSGGLAEISQWSDIVGATTRLAGRPRVFCPGIVAEEVRRILGGGARGGATSAWT